MHEDTEANGAVNQIAVGGILVMLALVIAVTVLPVLTSAIATAQADSNLTSGASTLLGLTPLVLVAGLVIGGVRFLISGVKGINQ